MQIKPKYFYIGGLHCKDDARTKLYDNYTVWFDKKNICICITVVCYVAYATVSTSVLCLLLLDLKRVRSNNQSD